MGLIRHSLRNLLRHMRAGELNLVVIAIILAVGAMTSVGFLVDRIGRALELEASQLLAADVLLTADHPWRADLADEARRRGLDVVASQMFPSVVMFKDQTSLAGIKAVEQGYPLRGKLHVQKEWRGDEQIVSEVPAPGTVWLDEKVASALGARIGDELSVGLLNLKLTAIVQFEADKGPTFMLLLPRLMMNLADVPASGLIREGSRVFYRLHMAGEQDVAADYYNWVNGRMQRGERVEDMAHARPELRAPLEKAQRYLRLASLLTVVLAAVAVGLSARRFMRRNMDACAVMRCLGAKEKQVFLLFFYEFLVLALVGAAIGCGIAYLVQAALAQLVLSLMALPLPPASYLPALQGVLMALVLVLGFVVPPLLRLGRVSTLRVLRRDLSGPEPLSWGAWAVGLLVIVGLLFWIADDVRLASYVSGGVLVALLVFWFLAWLVLLALDFLPVHSFGPFRLALAAIRRRRASVALQSLGLALGVTALLLLAITRSDLVNNWRQNLPPNAHNRFLTNIQPDEVKPIQDFFRAEHVAAPDLYPMVRGRMHAINGRVIRGDQYTDARMRQLVERELNLSWFEELPPGNKMVAGQWLQAGQPGFSLEQGIAKKFGIKVGDSLSLEVAGDMMTAPVTSLRTVAWDSMRVNFMFLAAPGMLEKYPTSYLGSVRLEESQEMVGHRLAARFPGVAVVDVSYMLEQLQNTVDQLVNVVQSVFLFTLGAGLAVLWAALEASFDERAAETALLRALGARHHQLRGALLIEFALLGGVAALMAVAGASAIGWALMHKVFYMSYFPNYPQLFVSAVLVVMLTAGLGLWGLRHALTRPVVAVLREA